MAVARASVCFFYLLTGIFLIAFVMAICHELCWVDSFQFSEKISYGIVMAFGHRGSNDYFVTGK